MKKHVFTLVLAVILLTQVSFAQDKGSHLINYRFLGIDNYSPYAKNDTPGEYKLKFVKPTEAFENSTLGAEISYYYGINDFLAVGLPLRLGAIRTPDGDQITPSFRKEFFGSADLRGKLTLALNDKQWILPYLSTGVGGMYLNEGLDIQIPIELGLNFKVGPNSFISLATEYRLSTDEMKDSEIYTFTNHFVHSLGIGIRLGDVANTPPPPPPPVEEEVEAPPADADGDGIVDDEDDCPDVAGLAKFSGCPDTDGDDITDADDKCPEVAGIAAFDGCPDTDSDGVADNEDKCPSEAGPASNDGCPEPEVKDQDNDGVADEDDACPTTPGVAAFNGCPDTDGDGVADKNDKCPSSPGSKALGGCPDTDGDGVADKDDKCPSTKGLVSNKGCPEIKQQDQQTLNFATQGIEFETGSSTIRTSSYSILDQVASVMAKYPTHSLSISGYTDNVGADATNLALSQRRAKACYDYLVSKGVTPSRMSHAGYGEAYPIADNGTKEGRQKNRRVEFRIHLK